MQALNLKTRARAGAAVPGRPQKFCRAVAPGPDEATGLEALRLRVGWGGEGAAGHGGQQFSTILEGVEPEVRLRDWTLQRCHKDTPRPGCGHYRSREPGRSAAGVIRGERLDGYMLTMDSDTVGRGSRETAGRCSAGGLPRA